MKQIKPLLISAVVGLIVTSAVIGSFSSYLFDMLLQHNGITLQELVETVQVEQDVITAIGQLDEAISDLEAKHAGGYIIGLKYFYDCDCFKVRMKGQDGEPKYYPAYKSRSEDPKRKGKWVYLKEGLEFIIYK